MTKFEAKIREIENGWLVWTNEDGEFFVESLPKALKFVKGKWDKFCGEVEEEDDP